MHTSEMTDRARGAFTIVSNIFISADSYPPPPPHSRIGSDNKNPFIGYELI